MYFAFLYRCFNTACRFSRTAPTNEQGTAGKDGRDHQPGLFPLPGARAVGVCTWSADRNVACTGTEK